MKWPSWLALAWASRRDYAVATLFAVVWFTVVVAAIAWGGGGMR